MAKKLWFDEYWIKDKKYTKEDLEFTLEYFQDIQNSVEQYQLDSVSSINRLHRIEILKKELLII